MRLPPVAAPTRAAAMHAFEPLLGGLVLNALHAANLTGPYPAWTFNAILAVCVIYQQPAVQAKLTHGDLHRFLWPRLGFHVAMYTAVLVVVGWGPLSGMAFIGTLSIHLRWVGSVAWPPAAVLGVASVVVGQVVIAAGWAFSYLDTALGNAIAAIVTVTVLLVSRLLGLTVRQRERAEQRLRTSEERFRTLTQHAADVITVADAQGRIDYVSPSVATVVGLPPERLVGTELAALVHPDDRALVEDGRERVTELRIRHADGSWRWHEAYVRDLRDVPSVGGIVLNHRDITRRRQDRERLLYEASHDPLTGLLNRAALWRLLDESLRRRQVALLYVDLDRFKHINDTMGHDAGDAVLTAFAGLLRRCVPASDAVARLGGDEFAVLLTGVRSADDATAVARRLIGELTEPLHISDRTVYARASVGVAVASANDDAGTLMRHADLAMYSAKRRKVGTWQLYVDGMAEDETSTAALELDLRHAIRDDQLRLQFQPIVDLGTGVLRGLEALVRWEHPVHGLLGPTAFVPLAEKQGLIAELGGWVLETACTEALRWQRDGRRVSVSVNLSPRELDRGPLVERVLTILRRTGFDPTDLVLEVTENALVDETVIPQLATLSAHGVRIALDDFGTGYSSLRYLTRLPVDMLKLDRCFVAELNGTSEGAAVADAVSRLSTVLRLDVVAEGIENAAQVDELRRLGFRAGQGFHFSRPLDPEQVDKLISEQALTLLPDGQHGEDPEEGDGPHERRDPVGPHADRLRHLPPVQQQQ
jgi:diguanylate cyclase (GGDEF)-like protein/PAS domain S-box-containing protein